jgi:hypothetical protein
MALLHWRGFYAKMPTILQGDITFLSCLGNRDHFYLGCIAQGGQSKYNSDCCVLLLLVFFLVYAGSGQSVLIWTDPEHRESKETVLCLLGWK